jgi:hypothetical protein
MMLSDLQMADYAIDAYHADARWQRGAIHACSWSPAEGVIVIGFRGSESITTLDGIKDWIIDLDDTVVTDPIVGPVCAGFLLDVLGVADQIAHDVDLALDLHLTGHSKGAPEASLLAARLVASGRPPAQLTTFGCPNYMSPGNTALPALLAQIPSTQTCGLDYHHADDPVWYVPPTLRKGRHAQQRQLGMPRFELNVVADHFMTGYRAALV